MRRYFILYLHFLRFSFSKAMEFRLDFTFRIIMDAIYYLVNILLFKVLFLHTAVVGGWTEPEMMIFISCFLMIDAINMTIFSTNLWWLPYYINRGELDFYLIRPVNEVFFLSLREFSANSFLNLLMAGALMIYSLMNYDGTYSLWELLFLIVLLINGSLLYYCLQMLMILPVFWTQSARGFVDLFYSMGIAMERPDRIYRGSIRLVFTTILPFALIASFPARIFLEGIDGKTLLHLFAVTLVMFFLMLLLWKRGLKNYASASS